MSFSPETTVIIGVIFALAMTIYMGMGRGRKGKNKVLARKPKKKKKSWKQRFLEQRVKFLRKIPAELFETQLKIWEGRYGFSPSMQRFLRKKTLPFLPRAVSLKFPNWFEENQTANAEIIRNKLEILIKRYNVPEGDSQYNLRDRVVEMLYRWPEEHGYSESKREALRKEAFKLLIELFCDWLKKNPGNIRAKSIRTKIDKLANRFSLSDNDRKSLAEKGERISINRVRERFYSWLKTASDIAKRSQKSMIDKLTKSIGLTNEAREALRKALKEEGESFYEAFAHIRELQKKKVSAESISTLIDKWTKSFKLSERQGKLLREKAKEIYELKSLPPSRLLPALGGLFALYLLEPFISGFQIIILLGTSAYLIYLYRAIRIHAPPTSREAFAFIRQKILKDINSLLQSVINFISTSWLWKRPKKPDLVSKQPPVEPLIFSKLIYIELVSKNKFRELISELLKQSSDRQLTTLMLKWSSDRQLTTLIAFEEVVFSLINLETAECGLGRLLYKIASDEEDTKTNEKFYECLKEIEEKVKLSPDKWRLNLFACGWKPREPGDSSEIERAKKVKEEVIEAFRSIGIDKVSDRTAEYPNQILGGIIVDPDPEEPKITYFYDEILPSTVYYPASGSDLETLKELSERFPHINEFILTDTGYNKLFRHLRLKNKIASIFKGKCETKEKDDYLLIILVGKNGYTKKFGIYTKDAKEFTSRDLPDKAPALFIIKQPDRKEALAKDVDFHSQIISNMRIGDYLFVKSAELPVHLLDPSIIGLEIKVDASKGQIHKYAGAGRWVEYIKRRHIIKDNLRTLLRVDNLLKKIKILKGKSNMEDKIDDLKNDLERRVELLTKNLPEDIQEGIVKLKAQLLTNMKTEKKEKGKGHLGIILAIISVISTSALMIAAMIGFPLFANSIGNLASQVISWISLIYHGPPGLTLLNSWQSLLPLVLVAGMLTKGASREPVDFKKERVFLFNRRNCRFDKFRFRIHDSAAEIKEHLRKWLEIKDMPHIRPMIERIVKDGLNSKEVFLGIWHQDRPVALQRIELRPKSLLGAGRIVSPIIRREKKYSTEGILKALYYFVMLYKQHMGLKRLFATAVHPRIKAIFSEYGVKKAIGKNKNIFPITEEVIENYKKLYQEKEFIIKELREINPKTLSIKDVALIERALRHPDERFRGEIKRLISERLLKIDRISLIGTPFESLGSNFYISPLLPPSPLSSAKTDLDKAGIIQLQIKKDERERVLDVNCATGIQAFWALSKGASSAVCIDEKPLALITTLLNAEELRYLPKVSVYCVDIKKLKEWQPPHPFGRIIFSGPVPVEQPVYNTKTPNYIMDRIYDIRGEVTEGFFEGIEQLLEEGGIINYSSSLNDSSIDVIKEIIKKRDLLIIDEYRRYDGFTVFTLIRLKSDDLLKVVEELSQNNIGKAFLLVNILDDITSEDASISDEDRERINKLKYTIYYEYFRQYLETGHLEKAEKLISKDNPLYPKMIEALELAKAEKLIRHAQLIREGKRYEEAERNLCDAEKILGNLGDKISDRIAYEKLRKDIEDLRKKMFEDETEAVITYTISHDIKKISHDIKNSAIRAIRFIKRRIFARFDRLLSDEDRGLIKLLDEKLKIFEEATTKYLAKKKGEGNLKEIKQALKENLPTFKEVFSSVKSLLKNARYAPNEDLKTCLSIIVESCVEILADIDRLFGEVSESMEKVDIRGMITSISDSHPEIEINTKSENIIPQDVFTYKNHVRKVLVELISNAIRSEATKMEVSVSLTDEGQIKVEVKDNGKGIEPERQDKIFMPGETEAKAPEDGTGYGLYAAKNTLESVGGTIILMKSKPKEGSIFTFTLPANIPSTHIEKEEKRNDSSSQSNFIINVLIIGGIVTIFTLAIPIIIDFWTQISSSALISPLVIVFPIALLALLVSASSSIKEALLLHDKEVELEETILPGIKVNIIEQFIREHGLKGRRCLRAKVNLNKLKGALLARRIRNSLFNLRNREEVEEVLFIAEDDVNQGRVTNVYLTSKYDDGEISEPSATYKYFPDIEKAEKVDLSTLDVIDAYNGIELKELGRITKLKIFEGKKGRGFCRIGHVRRSSKQKRPYFTISEEKMKKEFVGKTIVVRVEKYKDEDQIINLYLESEFSSSQNPQPLVTYKYYPAKRDAKIRRCRPVDLVILDLWRYFNGENVRPIEGRSTKIKIEKRHDGRGYRITIEGSHKTKDKLRLSVSLPEARKLCKSSQMPLEAEIGIKEDPDYGPYVEVYREGEEGTIIFSHYYYFPKLRECMSVDFSAKAFIDYAHGNRNIHGEEIAPREYWPEKKVNKSGSFKLIYRGEALRIDGLKSLKRKQVVFNPVKTEKGNYRIRVYEREAYRKNKNVAPRYILVRNDKEKNLALVDKLESNEWKDKVTSNPPSKGSHKSTRSPKLEKIFKGLLSKDRTEFNNAIDKLKNICAAPEGKSLSFEGFAEITTLIKQAKKKKNDNKRIDIILALGLIGAKDAISALKEFLKDKDENLFIRYYTCIALVYLEPSKALELREEYPELFRKAFANYFKKWTPEGLELNIRNVKSLMNININDSIMKLLEVMASEDKETFVLLALKKAKVIKYMSKKRKDKDDLTTRITSRKNKGFIIFILPLLLSIFAFGVAALISSSGIDLRELISRLTMNLDWQGIELLPIVLLAFMISFPVSLEEALNLVRKLETEELSSSDREDLVYALFEKIRSNPELVKNKKVFDAATEEVWNMSHAAINKSDSKAKKALSALIHILKIEGLDSYTYELLAEALCEIYQEGRRRAYLKTENKLSAEAVSVLEAVLMRDASESYARKSAAGALANIAVYGPEPSAKKAASVLNHGRRNEKRDIWECSSDALIVALEKAPPHRKTLLEKILYGEQAGQKDTGAGMIPAIRWVFNKVGIDIRYQAIFEQILFWSINLGLLAVSGLGSLGASIITWSGFFFLHFVRTKNMPNAPPWYSILTIAAINAVLAWIALPSLTIFPLLAFAIATGIHHIANIKSLNLKDRRYDIYPQTVPIENGTVNWEDENEEEEDWWDLAESLDDIAEEGSFSSLDEIFINALEGTVHNQRTKEALDMFSGLNLGGLLSDDRALLPVKIYEMIKLAEKRGKEREERKKEIQNHIEEIVIPAMRLRNFVEKNFYVVNKLVTEYPILKTVVDIFKEAKAYSKDDYKRRLDNLEKVIPALNEALFSTERKDCLAALVLANIAGADKIIKICRLPYSKQHIENLGLGPKLLKLREDPNKLIIAPEVSYSTGHEVTSTGRPLTKDEDKILKEALKGLFTDGLMRSYKIRPGDETYSRLDPDGELAKLGIIRWRPSGVDIYVIPDEILLKRLEKIDPPKALSIINTLVSHAGTHQDQAQNIFLLESRKDQLLTFNKDLRRQWAHHETEHIKNIRTPEEEIKRRAPIEGLLDKFEEVIRAKELILKVTDKNESQEDRKKALEDLLALGREGEKQLFIALAKKNPIVIQTIRSILDKHLGSDYEEGHKILTLGHKYAKKLIIIGIRTIIKRLKRKFGDKQAQPERKTRGSTLILSLISLSLITLVAIPFVSFYNNLDILLSQLSNWVGFILPFALLGPILGMVSSDSKGEVRRLSQMPEFEPYSIMSPFDGTEIAYDIYRNAESKKWVVITHGWCEDFRVLRSIVHSYLMQDYNILLFYMRGHGPSEFGKYGFNEVLGYIKAVIKGEQGKYFASLLTSVIPSDLNAIMRKESIDSAILIGHSMGGMAMLYFWLRYPKRVRAMIELATTPLNIMEGSFLKFIYGTGPLNRILSLPTRWFLETFTALSAPFTMWYRFYDLFPKGSSRRRILSFVIDSLIGRIFLRTKEERALLPELRQGVIETNILAFLAYFIAMTELDPKEIFKKIKEQDIPLVFIEGEEDLVVTTTGDALKPRTKIIKGLSHFLFVTETVGKIMREFINLQIEGPDLARKLRQDIDKNKDLTPEQFLKWLKGIIKSDITFASIRLKPEVASLGELLEGVLELDKRDYLNLIDKIRKQEINDTDILEELFRMLAEKYNIYSKDILQKKMIEELRRIWEVLKITSKDLWDIFAADKGTGLDRLKNVLTRKGQTTFEHTKALTGIESAFCLGTLETVIKVLNERKKPRIKKPLDKKIIKKLFEEYKKIPFWMKRVLQSAIAFHDIGRIAGFGEDAFLSIKYTKPTLDRLVKEKIITDKQRALIFALIYLHNNFNTLQFGEYVPGVIFDYFKRVGVNIKEYLLPASYLYIADAGSIGEGRLSDNILKNAIYLSKRWNLEKLQENWANIRFYLGFLGENDTPIDLSKSENIDTKALRDAKPALDRVLNRLENMDKEGYDYLFGEFLNDQVNFSGYATFIFRNLKNCPKGIEDLVKFLYLASKIYQAGIEFDILRFLPTGVKEFVAEEEEFTNVLNNLLKNVSLSQIKDLPQKDILEIVREDFGIILHYNADLKILTVDTKAMLTAYPTLLLGIQKGTKINIQSLRQEYPNINIKAVSLKASGEAQIEELEERLPKENGFGIILGKDVTDINEIKQKITPYIASLEKEELINKLSSIKEGLIGIIEALERKESPDSIYKMIKDLKLDKDQLAEIALTALSMSPIRVMDFEGQLAQINQALRQEKPIATITPSVVIEQRPDKVLNMVDTLKENKTEEGKSRNILIVSGLQEKAKQGYIETINKNINKLSQAKNNIDIANLYQIVTYDQMEEYVGKITKEENAQTKAQKLATMLTGEENLDIVCIGGESLFEKEIELARIIQGILKGDLEAIKTALELLGHPEGITIEELRGRVIDLRGYTEEVDQCRRAVQEMRRAL